MAWTLLEWRRMVKLFHQLLGVGLVILVGWPASSASGATTIRSSSSNASLTGNAVSVPAPVGTQAGDAVLVVVHGNGQTTISDNNGGTPFAKDLSDYQPNVSSGMTVSIFSRRIQAGDPTNYVFTMATTDRWSAVAVTLQNPDSSAIYDVAPSATNANHTDCPPCASTVDVPSITTLTDGSIAVALGLEDGSTSTIATGPAGYMPQQSTSPQVIALYTRMISPAGATGVGTFTFSRADGVIGLSFAIKNSGGVVDTQPPSVPANLKAGAVSAFQINLSWTSSTDNVGVVGYHIFRGGIQIGTSGNNGYLDTGLLGSTAYIYTVSAFDAAGNESQQSAPVAATTFAVPVSSGISSPIHALPTNPNYFTDGSGKAILLTGSHTWNSFQDTDQSVNPAPMNFDAYVAFLKAHHQNCTILWKKDLPTYCSWGAGGTWYMTPHPWLRTGGPGGTQMASDGKPAFDFNQFNQAYFDRLRARALELQTNGIYAVVELFDGLGLSNNRCPVDGYPFTGGNNVNGIDDGGGTGSMTMSTTNAITAIQDAYVRKVIDTINDLPNVLWEISEEAPTASTWWQNHMIQLIHSYESGKPMQHPVGYPTLNVNAPNDTALYNSAADWVAPASRISPTSSCGSGTPTCKVNINDSDHTYFGMWNDTAQANRNYLWENFANGNQVLFMDPYLVYWPSGNRNLPLNPTNGVGSAPDPRWDNFRDNLGYTLAYANKMNLASMTPQGDLSSTGWVLANTVPTASELLVYAPNGGTFTVNLTSSTNRALTVEWLNPATGTTTEAGTLPGGAASQSFTPSFGGDAVLYLADAALQRPTVAVLGLARGVPSLSVTGVTGLRYALEGTTNFVNWTTLAISNAPYVFAATNAAGLKSEFFRAQYLP